MDVVFEGRLTEEVQLRDVLRKILEKRPSGNLLLRISTTQRDCDGKLCIVDGRFITAAIVSTTRETGYLAVRKLLGVTEGNFACLRPSQGDSLNIPISLNIELEKVIPLVPHLPESPNGLHDEKSLLDKVFGATAFDPIEPKAEHVEAKAQNPNASWQLLQPLVAPNEIIESAAPPVRVIEPISADELARLQIPTRSVVVEKPDTKIRPPKRSSAISPLAIMSAVGLLLAIELLAIIFWKPLSAYLTHKTGDRQSTSINSARHPAASKRSPATSAKH